MSCGAPIARCPLGLPGGTKKYMRSLMSSTIQSMPSLRPAPLTALQASMCALRFEKSGSRSTCPQDARCHRQTAMKVLPMCRCSHSAAGWRMAEATFRKVDTMTREVARFSDGSKARQHSVSDETFGKLTCHTRYLSHADILR